MKKLLNIAFICFFTYSVSAQNRSIKKVIKELNQTLDVYETLSPNAQEYYNLHSLNVSEDDITRAFDEPLEQRDSILNFDALYLVQSKIDHLLREALLHKKAKNIDFKAFIRNTLGIVKSQDNKLYSFSLYEKTGGSYHSFLSWIFYLDDKHFIEFPTNDDWHLNQDDKQTVFEANGYDKIKSFIVKNKMHYLLFGTTKACGACFIEFVTLVHFENGKFILDFEYSVESRSSKTKLFFDDTSLSLSVFYETDDLTSECYCSDEQLEERLDKDNNDIDVTKIYNCSCLFIYENGTFKLAKHVTEPTKD